MGSLSKKKRSIVAKKAAKTRAKRGAKFLTAIALKAWKTRRANERKKSSKKRAA